MRRNIDLDDISDGELYGSEDMVDVGCGGCEDCGKCCHHMGTSIVLDPFDIYNLRKGLKMDFDGLLAGYIDMNVQGGIILPNIRMDGNEDEKCQFLDERGLCTIHMYRPGICRLFPLGRVYTEEGFKYFLQIYECYRYEETFVRPREWMNIENYEEYRKFVIAWHDFIIKMQDYAMTSSEQERKNASVVILNTFYYSIYDMNEDFYKQFYIRLNRLQEILGM